MQPSGWVDRFSCGKRGSTRGAFAFALIVALYLLFAALPAAASAAGNMHVKVEGTGQGEVSSSGGVGAFKNENGANNGTFESLGAAFEGAPPIACESPAPGVGTCETPLVTSEALEGVESIALHAIPAPGSEFVGWTVEEGGGAVVGCEVGGSFTETGENPTFCLQGALEGADIKIAATFNLIPAIVTEVKPTKGSVLGGNSVEIVGTGLGEATKVEFGTTTATIVENTATLIKAEAPAHGPGQVDVTVTTASGASATGPADKYTYVAVPVVNKITPVKGPAAGGTEVEITGTNLSAPTKVEFGSVEVLPPFKSTTSTRIVLQTPAHEPGAVDVKVTTVGGTSAGVAADKFTFLGQRALSVATNGTGSGSITCNGGACAPSYEEGSTVTLAASPASSSTFAGWSGGGCSGTGGCVVTMNADTAVTATFTAKPKEECATNPALCPPPAPGVLKVQASAPYSGGKASLKGACNGGTACSGSLQLKAKIKQGKKTKTVVIGKASYNIGAGATKTISVRISSGPAKSQLNKGTPLKATLVGTGLKGSVTIKPPKKKKK
jgi:hypothetical protein